MKRFLKIDWLLFLAFIAVVAVFVQITSQSMPATVASHFGISGAADSFMSRRDYVNVMLFMATGLPVMIVIAITALIGQGAAVNIPYREYWLSSERRAATLSYLKRQAMYFGVVLAVFLSFMHWLVIQGNLAQPPQRSNGLFGLAMITFLVICGVGVGRLIVRFRRPAE